MNDANWRDKLTSYNGQAITYVAIGNPLSYLGKTMTWDYGRSLMSVDNTQYAYNSEGTRVSKTVGGVQTEYLLDGSKIVGEKTGSSYTWYYYDADGRVAAMNKGGVYYYYEYNAQGDVIGLYNNQLQRVARYVYDSWGKLVSITDGNGNDGTNDPASIGYQNPFRYRGYYYDNETGFYYLQSRYYDAETGRFINADDTDILDNGNDDILENNLFAYCYNNPVRLKDDSGYVPVETVLDVASIGWSGYDLITNPSWANAGFLLWDIAATLIPYVPGSYVVKGVKLTAKTMAKADNAIDLAKTTYKMADKTSDIRKSTGSYEIMYKSGKNYVGKGGYKRMLKSATRYDDEVASMSWKPAKNQRSAFIDEYYMMRVRGVHNANTYNKIWSPGRNYYYNDLINLFR